MLVFNSELSSLQHALPMAGILGEFGLKFVVIVITLIYWLLAFF
jgi:hypothetical protein